MNKLTRSQAYDEIAKLSFFSITKEIIRAALQGTKEQFCHDFCQDNCETLCGMAREVVQLATEACWEQYAKCN